jgi:dienelactone hydrolase
MVMRKLLLALIAGASLNAHAFLFADTVTVNDSKLGKVTVTIDKYTKSTPSPTIILAHTCAGVLRPMDTNWALTMRGWGYNVVIPDSFKPRGFQQTCTQPRAVSMRQRNEDMAAVAEWIERQDWHKGKIGLIGFSNGGWLVMEAANRPLTEKIVAMVAYYPWCDTRYQSKPVVPTQIHIGKEDDWTPAEQCEPMKDIANYDMHFYNNAYHSFDRPAPDRVAKGHTEKLHRLGYNATATKLAEQRTREFFSKHLN